MQVVEYDDERAVLRSASEEPAHGLEHLKARARLRQGRRVAELGEELAYLGQELRQERGSGSELGPQGVRVRFAQMHLEGLDPGPVRRGAARLPRAPDQDLRTARARLLHQSVGKAALSDSRLAGHEHHASVARERFIQAGHQLGELPVAADERAPRRGGRGLMLIPRGGRLELQRHILGEDRALELPEPFARLYAELFDERGTGVLVGLKRLGLTVRAIQGEHQLGAQPLPVRMLSDQRLQVLDHLGMAAERELGVDQLLERGDPEVIQACHLRLRERLERELRERLAAPQRQRLLERGHGRLGASRGQLRAPLRDEPLEAVRVEGLRVERQLVATLASHDRPR